VLSTCVNNVKSSADVEILIIKSARNDKKTMVFWLAITPLQEAKRHYHPHSCTCYQEREYVCTLRASIELKKEIGVHHLLLHAYERCCPFDHQERQCIHSTHSR
jgi:hypothetical protein